MLHVYLLPGTFGLLTTFTCVTVFTYIYLLTYLLLLHVPSVCMYV